jgi:hypothetical protein
VWVATSADALFAGIGAWAVSLMVLALGRDGPRADALALVAGLLFGAGLFLSYGIALLGVIAITVALVRRRVRPLLIATAGVAVVAGGLALAGFWWWDGLQATLGQYGAGISRRRDYEYFVLNNMAAFALALGPAVAVALGRLRDARIWVLVGGSLAAAAMANISGLSKGEVERIWLPLAFWMLVSTCALSTHLRRGMLSLQALTAVAIQSGVRVPW